MGNRSTFPVSFGDVRMFRTCEQCGRCSSACPLTGVDSFNIRRILRHVELGLIDEVAGTPLPWSCTTCGRCESACPNGIAILDILRRLRVLAPEGLAPEGPPPCVKACPGGIDIPGYLRHIARGDAHKAYELILESVPFPGILGRVCPRPCEQKCRRAEVNEAVAICALKRHAADRAGEVFEKALAVQEDTGRRVAVVGAGPAGLTAAFHLRKKGHAVTVFEALERPGGMMRYGIPRYRLPEEVLDREIDRVLSVGIDLKTGVKLGQDIDLDRLKAEGFDAVFLATGLQQSKKIPLEGAGLECVHRGVEFLRAVSGGQTGEVGDRVVVVGGGDVAVDVALTALRLGAGSVTLACLESREEMPAHTWEIEAALEEDVQILPSWGPERIRGADGRVTGIDLIQCTSVFDDKGGFNPTFSEARKSLPADQVFLAVGQTSDLSFNDGAGMEVERDLVVVKKDTGETTRPGVFAGGEIATGPGALIEAVAEGKRIAAAMDRFLGGDGVVETRWAERADTTAYDGKRDRDFADRVRCRPAVLPVAERHCGFPEVERGLEDEDAVREAGRCLECDLEQHPERLVPEEEEDADPNG